MPTISVRLTDDEVRRLQKYGPLSKTVREALELYESERKRTAAVKKLRQLQREHPVSVDTDEIVRIIREGRNH